MAAVQPGCATPGIACRGEVSPPRLALAGGGRVETALVLSLVELDLRVDRVVVLGVVVDGGLDEPDRNPQVAGGLSDRSVVVVHGGDHLPDVKARADHARAATAGSVDEPDERMCGFGHEIDRTPSPTKHPIDVVNCVMKDGGTAAIRGSATGI